jgi:hypothetical protein
MKLFFETENKPRPLFLVGILAATLFVSALAFNPGPGVIPSPGHALTEMQGYFEGDNSIMDTMGKMQQRVSENCAAGSSIRSINVDGTVVCETDDEGSGPTITGTLETTVVSCPGSCTVACPAGYVVTGGDWDVGSVGGLSSYYISRPSGNGWECNAGGNFGTCRAVCGRIV